MSYNQKCNYFSMEYVGNPGAVPACNKDEVLEVFDCSDCEYNPYNKKTTNADGIRAMTDEELCDEYFRILNHQLGNYTDSRLGLLKWLKEEVNE